jgi:long-chain acyl-CoA synthetase
MSAVDSGGLTVTGRSVPEMFERRVKATPGNAAFLYPSGNGWKTLTWRQTGDRVRAIASGLLSLGLLPEQRCAIVSSTRVEWVLADLAIVCAGGATTTIYPANTPEEAVCILQDSEAAFVFVEDAVWLAKLASRRSELPAVQKVVLFDGPGTEDGWAIPLASVESRGRVHDATHPEVYPAVAGAVQAGSLATIIYTSGTTGQPKGVELAHDCWIYQAEAIDALRMLGADDLHYLWLPLAHVFGKVLEAAQIRIGFPTAIDGRVDKLVDNLKVIRPTFICAVPRIFEKVYNAVLGAAQEAGGLKRRIFRWALAAGEAVSKARQAGDRPGALLAAKSRVADALVFKKVRARFGGRLRFFISGSAPLSRELAEFFHALGVLVLEGYGLTESTAAFVNHPTSYRFGSVGQALPGTDVRIAEDGEILLRSRGVMRRYHNRPDATAETVDSGGWLRTGDIGHLDEDGFLTITDRKKDLIKTSGGKYVAPQAVEMRLTMLCRYVSHVLVHGDNRKFCSALITPNEAEIRVWAKQAGLENMPMAALVQTDPVRRLIQAAIDDLNAKLPRHESIRRFAILPAEFSVESGELTPSLKVKRRLVEKKYAALLDSFYEGAVREL